MRCLDIINFVILETPLQLRLLRLTGMCVVMTEGNLIGDRV